MIGALRLEFGTAVIDISVGARVGYRFEYAVPEVVSDVEGFVVVSEPDVPLPRGATLECRTEGLWFVCIGEVPGEHWSFGLESFGLRYDTLDAAREGGYGDRLPVGYDLEWEVDPRADDPARGRVRGEVLLARTTIDIDTVGRFAFGRD